MSRGFRLTPISFEYTRDVIDGKEIFRPRAAVKLSWGDKTFPTFMLLDSGADISFIPQVVARQLGLVLDDSSRRTSRAASGPFETWTTSVDIRLVHQGHEIPLGRVLVSVPTEDADVRNLSYYLLLGRDPLFTLFDVTFKESQRKVFLSPASRPFRR